MPRHLISFKWAFIRQMFVFIHRNLSWYDLNVRQMHRLIVEVECDWSQARILTNHFNYSDDIFGIFSCRVQIDTSQSCRMVTIFDWFSLNWFSIIEKTRTLDWFDQHETVLWSTWYWSKRLSIHKVEMSRPRRNAIAWTNWIIHSIRRWLYAWASAGIDWCPLYTWF